MLQRRRFNYDNAFFDQGNLDAALCCKWGYVPEHTFDIYEERPFFCGLGSCVQRFQCHKDFEYHYESMHRHVCDSCGRVLQTPRLLELHVAESHDAYFKVS
jgi:hypothetical protein